MVRLSVVLDTSALSLAAAIEGRAFTTTKNLEEARKGPYAPSLPALTEAGKLVVRDPAPSSVKVVRETAAKTGDLAKLSEADLSVIALACELVAEGRDVVLMSDDYSVQNVALSIGIKVAPVTTKGIRELIEWIFYCPVCGTVYRGRKHICPECGAPLKRKRRRSSHDRLRGPSGM